MSFRSVESTAFINILRSKSIKIFSAKASPLILAGLKQMRAKSPEVKQAFEQLKLDLKSSLVLKPPEINATYIITTDASDYALGAVIEILDKKTSKIKGTVAFYSKALDKHQRNYSIREKELLAIIQTLTRFRHFLLGSTIVIKTDHKSLQYLINNKKPPSSRLSRWLDVLSEFDITIDYIKGNTNIADALSRKFTELVKSDTDYDANDSEGLTIANTTTSHIETHPLGEDILEEIKESYSQDEQAHEIHYYLSNQLDPPNSIKYRIKKFNYRNGILYFKRFDYRAEPIERIWIPSNLNYKVIDLHHSPDTTLHPGAEVTYLEMVKFYYWPNMFNSIKRFVRHCNICQAIKPRNNSNFGLLQPLPKIMLDEISRLHGLPDEIIHDNDVRLATHFWQDFFRELKVELHFTSVYHPQSDDQTERTNRTLIALLRAFVKKNDQDWLLKLPIVEYAYNAHVHKAIKMTPFEADLGYIPKALHVDSRLRQAFPISSLPNNSDYTFDFANMLKLHQTLIPHNILESQASMKKQYNKHRQPLNLKTGDSVLINRKANIITTSFRTTKQSNLCFGPYRVIKADPNKPNNYLLELGLSPDHNRSFNVKFLKKYNQSNTEYPLSTKSYSQTWARRGKIDKMVGLNTIAKKVAFTFKDCDPFHAVLFDLDEAKEVIREDYFNKLLRIYNSSNHVVSSGPEVQSEGSIEDEDVEMVDAD
ncbi:uncharacterized protein KGF55_005806 [Candida pseudojiufengensis]|uniref:uncharacterized protein n=1 Tax=Candida pseudojiufengensis TaxID=497109 RepID=UPI0022254BC7|nr:uncharacterized protein KGF55_005806 [Candida pseudojiufengensis]KAI5958463.1 hypothetical protein KGF55_005806 [Candida pseudojiufengensis]